MSLSHTSALAAGFDFEMVRPVFIKRGKNGPFLDIKKCSHPCVALYDDRTYIPNDTVLGTAENESNFVIATGPNMGGKSTLLRQTCVAVILAQIGCFVPCAEMRLTPVDRIFTRVGANDRILAGQSTFMVELEETSNILRHATQDSLVILDELGRGTSTFDGTAIAYAVAKQIIEEIECRCLFSTHYHGLSEAFAKAKGVCMYHMAYKGENGRITFLYEFVKGVCTDSHGVNCARLAGMSEHILDRARKKSEGLHKKMHSGEEEVKDSLELVEQFKEISMAVFAGNLWDKIEYDLI